MGMNMVQLDNNNFIVQSHVGQVIMSTTLDTEDKVKQYYGGTSWTKIEGKFLIGASSSYGVGTTGGEATHVLTTAEMPSHTHNLLCGYGETSGGRDALRYQYWGGNALGWKSWLSENTGGSQAHNNIPPYYAVYIWVRTA
jgi:hypothetical protein